MSEFVASNAALPCTGRTSAPRSAQIIWLLRRAAILEGVSADARDEPHDPGCAALLRHVADKVWRALDDPTVMTLTPEERATVAAEAEQLTLRAITELGRAGERDLSRGEEWLRTARAFRELVGVSGST